MQKNIRPIENKINLKFLRLFSKNIKMLYYATERLKWREMTQSGHVLCESNLFALIFQVI